MVKLKSLDEVLALARAELATNPTITVYTFKNGVEQRRPYNQFLQISVAFRGLAESMRRAAQQFRDAFGPLVDRS